MDFLLCFLFFLELTLGIVEFHVGVVFITSVLIPSWL